ncbi:MAG: YceI family protein [Flavobacteriales bacterium]
MPTYRFIGLAAKDCAIVLSLAVGTDAIFSSTDRQVMGYRTVFLVGGCLAMLFCAGQEPGLLRVSRSAVSFISDAPMERIEARTSAASGVLDVRERSFAIQLPVRGFEGFNSPLQREHFNENYMQSDVFPNAVFKGRIIEAADLARFATYRVRAKGSLIIHGVERERIIECLVMVGAEGVRVTSTFDIVLSEHDVRVPRVVQQKISPRAQVNVDVLFTMGEQPRR